ncbi:hypothetical protein KSC_071200 [Ktedonobacter sp. SOSP1-52]|nr:hypothetical protein KSC_071200 [Ktedonobacter sp. SOSP1-52]
MHLPPGVEIRQLTLNETFDAYGRLLQLLGTNRQVQGGFGRGYEEPVTEVVKEGKTQVW